jgi:hypothetical protein
MGTSDAVEVPDFLFADAFPAVAYDLRRFFPAIINEMSQK